MLFLHLTLLPLAAVVCFRFMVHRSRQKYMFVLLPVDFLFCFVCLFWFGLDLFGLFLFWGCMLSQMEERSLAERSLIFSPFVPACASDREGEGEGGEGGGERRSIGLSNMCRKKSEVGKILEAEQKT